MMDRRLALTLRGRRRSPAPPYVRWHQPVADAYAKLARVTDVPSPATEPRATPALTADDIVAVTGGRLLARSGRQVLGAAVDSRAVLAGNVFVALPGEHTDGHAFLDAAVAAGAAALLVSREAPGVAAGRAGDVSVVLVPDALAGLQALAAAWRRRFHLLVVGVTGSVAKTSTKEAIAAVLGRRYATLRNEGNLNNEIGLPLTVLRMRPEHEAAVLEMGMYVGGEIADLARIGRPRFGVVTAVAGVHLSRIGSLDAIERAKGELVEALPSASGGGVAVLNGDDERVSRMDARTSAAVLRYGFGPAADVRASAVVSRGRDGMEFDLVAGGATRRVSIPVPGRHSVHNGLAAAAVGIAAGMTVDEIAAGLALGWSAPHRTELRDIAGVLVIDDTYNASPRSMSAALDTLAGMPGRHVAVLGQMLELGEEHDQGHREVGEVAARTADRVIVVGDEASGIADAAMGTAIEGAATLSGEPNESGSGAPRRIDVTRVPDREHALELLLAELRPGDVVLLKASRGLGLPEAEKTVRGLGLDVLVDDLARALEERRS